MILSSTKQSGKLMRSYLQRCQWQVFVPQGKRRMAIASASVVSQQHHPTSFSPSAVIKTCGTSQLHRESYLHRAFLFVMGISAGGIFWDQGTRSNYHVSHCESESSTRDDAEGVMEALGVNEEEVDALVQKLLDDPSVNITMLPDPIEAQLYRSTILLTLNAIYSLFKGIRGSQVLSHELQVKIERNPAQHKLLTKTLADRTAKNVNDHVLKEVARRLLENPAVNSPWVPDVIEAQIYSACLQVMFRVTQIILSTIKVNLCGHDIQLSLVFSGELESAALSAARSTGRTMTPVDLEILKKIAHESGVDGGTKTNDWWNRFVIRSNFVEQLHVSLYGLILGLLDDLLLGQLKIQILSDTIHFDLIPSTPNHDSKDRASPVKSNPIASPPSSSKTPAKHSILPYHNAIIFTIGIGVGAVLMKAITNR